MDGRRIAPLALAVLVAALPHPGIAGGPPALGTAELRCLAANIYWEARGEPPEGQAAVAHVTLNRVRSPGFPRSVCGVVHQANQFGWTLDKSTRSAPDGPAWEQALNVARQAATGGRDPTNGALYFHHRREKPDWAQGRYTNRRVIGEHVFFSLRQRGETQLAELAP